MQPLIAAPEVDLTIMEIDRICHPLVQRAAKVRYLRDKLGLTVRVTRNGDPLVNRLHYNETMTGRPLAAGEADKLGDASNASVIGLQQWARNRKARSGKKA